MTKNNSKNWKEIEEEFMKWYHDSETKDRSDKTILNFFKPYFQEQRHTEAVEELEIVDNSKLNK